MDTMWILPGSFRAVVLDLDGLLVDTEPIWLRAKHTMYGRYGTTYEPADHLALYGSSDAFSAAWFTGRFGLTAAHEETIRLEYLELVAELLGEGVPTRPGARELLTTLRGRVPLGLATNTKRPLADIILDRSGLAGSFDAETTGDEGRSKPEPDIYLLACSRLGIPPDQAVALEDSPLGVRAAKAAGLTCIAIPSEEHADLAHADGVVPSLHHLL
jgi:HAD superfamily hydrolase (TIGR01509 family)